MSYDWLQLECLLTGVQPPERIKLHTVNGTAVGPDVGFPADLARAVSDERFEWVWDEYPSATFPMGPSVNAGVATLIANINAHEGPTVLAGYSQGAIIACLVWRDHILNPAGELHHRLNDILGVITYGNPMRSPGVAYGNVYGGQPIPGKLDGQVTGGIAGPDCLTAEQCLFPAGHPKAGRHAVIDFANPGDLYAAAPVGDSPWTKQTAVGHDETLIYRIIQNASLANVEGIAAEVIKVISDPWEQVIPLVEAIYNGGLFFALGMNAPHYQYNIDAAARWLNELVA